MLGVWYNFVNFCAETSPGLPGLSRSRHAGTGAARLGSLIRKSQYSLGLTNSVGVTFRAREYLHHETLGHVLRRHAHGGMGGEGDIGCNLRLNGNRSTLHLRPIDLCINVL